MKNSLRYYIFSSLLFFVFATPLLGEETTICGSHELASFLEGEGKVSVDSLTITESDSVIIAESELLKLSTRISKIKGKLTLQGLSTITTLTGLVDAIDCSEAGFEFYCCPLLADVNAFFDAGIKSVHGDLIFDSCPKVVTGAANSSLGKSFSQIENVDGSLVLRGLTAAMSKPEYLLPCLKTVGGDFIVEGCTRLYYFTNASSTADMPLKSIGGNLVLRNNKVLQRLNGFGHLKHIGGNVTIMDNGAIPNGSDGDPVIGWGTIRYYQIAGIIAPTAIVTVGTTAKPIDITSITPTPYEVIEETDGTYEAIPVTRFLNSIGVNSAINSRGESVNTTLEIMKYIGARWIRTTMGGSLSGGITLKETAASGAGNAINVYKKLYEEGGIRFSGGLGAGGVESNVGTLISNMKRVIAATSPDIFIAVEGNNEPNNGSWYVKYQGEIGGGNKEGKYNWKPVARMQRKLYEDVKADPVLGTEGYNYPVWDLTYGGAEGENVGLQYLKVPEDDNDVVAEFRGVTFADVANLHNYFSHPSFKAPQDNQTWRAAEPGNNIPPGCDVLYRHYGRTWMNKYLGYRTDAELRALRKVTTETGVKITDGVTEEMQALMYVSCYLSQFARGFEHTSIYLLTDRRDESGDQSFGIYDKKYNPRQAAHYLHNLTTVLQDKEDIAAPDSLTYTVDGKSINVHNMLFEKSDGTFEIVIWGENYKGGTDHVTVSFPTAYDDIWVYDVTSGVEPVTILKDANSVKLDITDHPFIIEIGKHPEIEAVRNVETRESAVEMYDLAGHKVFENNDVTAGFVMNMNAFDNGVYIRVKKDADGNIVEREKIMLLNK